MILRHLTILLFIISSISCERELNVKEAPTIKVSTEKNVFKVGEPVLFSIEGSADIVSFYSGEAQHDYTHRDGKIIDISGYGASVSFRNAVTPGIPPGTQENQLSILISTDFKGDYSNLSEVKKSNWIDITDNFELSNSSNFINSGKFNISDFTASKSPFYIAFKYINRPQLDNGFAKQWMIENFQLKSELEVNNEDLVIYDLAHMGFRIIDQDTANMPSRSTITNNRITLYGPVYKDPNDPIYDPENPIYDPENPIYDPDSDKFDPRKELPEFEPYDENDPYNDPSSENWAVSRRIVIDEVNLAANWAIPVRHGIYLSMPTEYSYTYDKPGNYKAVFVSSNNTIDDEKKVVQEISITIEP